MGEDAEDISRHAAGIQHIQKLHSLHLETIITINHEQYDIGDFGDINHASEGVGWALDEGQTALFGRDDSEGAGGL